MKDRIGLMVGQVVEGMPWMGTFHSIGVKIMRRHAEAVGLKSNFTILDVDDQIRLIKQLLEAEKIDEKRWPARVFAGILDGWKNRGLTPEQVPAGEAAGFANGKGKKLYFAYQQRLKTLNAADFGDLLLECIRLFRQHPDVLRQYQSRFKYILVDEYQDTNVAQYLWLRLLSQASSVIPGRREAADPESRAHDTEPAALDSGLAPSARPGMTEKDGEPGEGMSLEDSFDLPADEKPPHPPSLGFAPARAPSPTEGKGKESAPLALDDTSTPPHPTPLPASGEREQAALAARSTPKNICCVGDDDQSIYGWRGAEVDNILRFEHDFPGAKVIRLERNYRSTGHILAAASHLIAHNEGRLGKTLRTEDVPGEKVTVTSCWDSEEEARAIGEVIEEHAARRARAR